MLNPVAESVPRLKRLLPRLKGRRIGVIGDLMLDRYLSGSSTKLSPEVPVPVVNFEKQTESLGGAANVAANLAALGARVEVFGVTGEDEAGAVLTAKLRQGGIGEKGTTAHKSRMTTVKTRVIARKHQIVRIDHERDEPIAAELENKIFRQLLKVLTRLDGLVLSDYDKGVLKSDVFVERILAAAHRAEVPVFVKPPISRLHSYPGARIVVCNTKEAGFYVTRLLDGEEAFADAMAKLLGRFGASAIVVTRGGEGMSVMDESSSSHITIPATSFEETYAHAGKAGANRETMGRQVFDVTGAGDTVLSVLSLAVAAGATLVDAAVLANTAAGVVVGKLGTASVSVPELTAAIAELDR